MAEGRSRVSSQDVEICERQAALRGRVRMWNDVLVTVPPHLVLLGPALDQYVAGNAVLEDTWVA